MPRRIESWLLDGPAGKLESLLEEPEGEEPRACCVVCHPHPLYGGTMHNKVVYRLARGLRMAGSAVLRFNFRGVGNSQGSHDFGNGEIEDARAALSWLRTRYSGLRYALAGFSFGSRVVLRLGCSLSGTSPPPARLIAAGFPTRYGETGYVESCSVPKVFVQSTRDEHGPRPELEALWPQISEPKRLIWIDAGDHFFAGALDAFEAQIRGLGM